MVKYLVKGIIHTKLLDPWPVDKDGVFTKVTEELNRLSKDGWQLVSVIPAGNSDRALYIFKK